MYLCTTVANYVISQISRQPVTIYHSTIYPACFHVYEYLFCFNVAENSLRTVQSPWWLLSSDGVIAYISSRYKVVSRRVYSGLFGNVSKVFSQPVFTVVTTDSNKLPSYGIL